MFECSNVRMFENLSLNVDSDTANGSVSFSLTNSVLDLVAVYHPSALSSWRCIHAFSLFLSYYHYRVWLNI